MALGINFLRNVEFTDPSRLIIILTKFRGRVFALKTTRNKVIASFTRRFIFIKTRKTGGTSTEIILSSWCSGNDICTTLIGTDEIDRYALGGAARNFLPDPKIDQIYADTVSQGDAKAIQKLRKKYDTDAIYYNHMPASTVKERLGDLWQDAYKITIERHPYDRAISAAWWNARKRNPSPDTIGREIEEAIEAPTFPNFPLYTESGRVIVDHIMRFETLSDELEQLSKRLGTVLPSQLPRAKSTFRKDRSPSREVLTPSQMKRIREVAAPEFDIMGYES